MRSLFLPCLEGSTWETSHPWLFERVCLWERALCHPKTSDPLKAPAIEQGRTCPVGRTRVCLVSSYGSLEIIK